MTTNIDRHAGNLLVMWHWVAQYQLEGWERPNDNLTEKEITQ